MTDFTVNIYNEISTVDVETTVSETLFNIETINSSNSLIIDNSNIESSNIIEISSQQYETLEIISNTTASVIFATDIVGLDNYLSNFIDHYSIDCGQP